MNKNINEWMIEIIDNIREDINHARGTMEGLKDMIIDKENGIEVKSFNLEHLKKVYANHKPETKTKVQGIRSKGEWLEDAVRDGEESIKYCLMDIKDIKVKQLKTKNGMIARTYILSVLEEHINQQLEKDKHAFDNLEEIWIDTDTIIIDGHTGEDEPAYSPNQWKEIKGREYHE